MNSKLVAFASWRCCSIVAKTREEIPPRCPEHDEYLLAAPELVKWNEGMEMGVVCHRRSGD
jgi:hypothetical protein